MRSPALKLILVLLTLGLLMCAGSSDARSPVSVRVLAGVSQAGAYQLDDNLSDPTLLIGVGTRIQLSKRHSVFLDIERIELANRPATNAESYLTDFALSRDPLTEANSSFSPYWPITLGYQYDILGGDAKRISPHFTFGVSMLRTSTTNGYSRYPNLDISSSEEIESDKRVGQTDFGVSLGIGCSAQVNSFISVSLDGRFRNLGLPVRSFQTRGRSDTQQNISGLVFEGTDYEQSPGESRAGAYEAKLIFEFHL